MTYCDGHFLPGWGVFPCRRAVVCHDCRGSRPTLHCGKNSYWLCGACDSGSGTSDADIWGRPGEVVPPAPRGSEIRAPLAPPTCAITARLGEAPASRIDAARERKRDRLEARRAKSEASEAQVRAAAHVKKLVDDLSLSVNDQKHILRTLRTMVSEGLVVDAMTDHQRSAPLLPRDWRTLRSRAALCPHLVVRDDVFAEVVTLDSSNLMQVQNKARRARALCSRRRLARSRFTGARDRRRCTPLSAMSAPLCSTFLSVSRRPRCLLRVALFRRADKPVGSCTRPRSGIRYTKPSRCPHNAALWPWCGPTRRSRAPTRCTPSCSRWGTFRSGGAGAGAPRWARPRSDVVARSQNAAATQVCIGLLPVPKKRRAHGGPAEGRTHHQKAADHQVYHDALALVFAQFERFARDGIQLRDRTGAFHTYTIRLLGFIADHEEKAALTTLNLSSHCPNCLGLHAALSASRLADDDNPRRRTDSDGSDVDSEDNEHARGPPGRPQSAPAPNPRAEDCASLTPSAALRVRAVLSAHAGATEPVPRVGDVEHEHDDGHHASGATSLGGRRRARAHLARRLSSRLRPVLVSFR